MQEKLVERVTVRGLTVYRFYQKSTDAVDHYLMLAQEDVQAHIAAEGDDALWCYAIDVSQSGMFSLNYMRNKATPLIKSVENFPVNYIAYLTNNVNDTILVNMLDALAKRELQTTRKVFHINQLDDAIDWLLSIQANA